MIRFEGGFLPNLVVAGAPKCGTSSLHRWLEAHPQVMSSNEKETYFLSDPGTHMFRPNATIHRGLAGYLKYFPVDRGQDPSVVMESTPSYLYSDTALNWLPHLPSKPKVVFIVREPSSQVYSLFRFFRDSWNWIPKELSFAEFVDLALAGTPLPYKGNELAQNAIQNAKYVDRLLSWRSSMGNERMSVYNFDELAAHPRAFAQKVATFVGIDPGFFDDLPFDASNETFGVHSRLLHNFNIALRGRMPKGALYNAARSIYRKLNTTAPNEKSQDDRDAITRLKPIFAESVERLALEFDLDIRGWL